MSSSDDFTYLSAAERAELLALRDSADLCREMRALRRSAASRPVDLDAYVRFATALSRMAGHPRRPFRSIVDRDMRL